MKVIIAGSRTITDYHTVEKAVEMSGFSISEVVSGGARGTDEAGEYYAITNGIPFKMFRADWKRHGKSAGPIRNQLMVDYADALIAVWDGVSRGTEDVVGRAKMKGMRVYVYNTSGVR